MRAVNKTILIRVTHLRRYLFDSKNYDNSIRNWVTALGKVQMSLLSIKLYVYVFLSTSKIF